MNLLKAIAVDRSAADGDCSTKKDTGKLYFGMRTESMT